MLVCLGRDQLAQDGSDTPAFYVHKAWCHNCTMVSDSRYKLLIIVHVQWTGKRQRSQVPRRARPFPGPSSSAASHMRAPSSPASSASYSPSSEASLDTDPEDLWTSSTVDSELSEDLSDWIDMAEEESLGSDSSVADADSAMADAAAALHDLGLQAGTDTATSMQVCPQQLPSSPLLLQLACHYLVATEAALMLP